MAVAGAVALTVGIAPPTSAQPRWEIRIHCIWNRARYIVYTLYLEQISDIQAYCIYIVFGNGLDTLYIHCTWTAPDCISHLHSFFYLQIKGPFT